MWYAIISEDVEDSLEMRIKTRAAHIERLRGLAEDGRISVADLPSHLTKIKIPSEPGNVVDMQKRSLRDQIKAFEISVINNAIDAAGGDRRIAAHNLEVGLSTLYRKLEEAEE